MTRRIPILVGLVQVLCGFCAAEIPLAPQGKPLPIVVQKNRIPAEKTAEQELRTYLTRMAGVSFLSTEEAPSGPAIRLVSDTSMGEEEWSVKTTDDGSIVISGGRPRGLLYGTYHFLEDVLGVRWLSPVVEHVPQRPTLAVGRLDLHGKPAMPYRAIYLVPGEGGARFLARNRMIVDSVKYGGRRRTFGGTLDCHTVYTTLGSPEEVRRLYKEHPDWFPLIGGKRYCHVERANSAAQSQLCFTNPELREYWVGRMRELIRRDRARADELGTGYPLYYAIDQNDCYDGFCTCSNCATIATREGSNAGILLDFANYVAEKLEGEAPEARFQMMALHSTEKPPKYMRARKNVTIRLCDTTSNELVPWTDAQNAKHLENLRAWTAHADSVSMWDYQITYGSASVVCHPTPAERTFAADIRMLRDNKGDGFFFEHEMPVTADMRDLKVWLEFKLVENPDLDGERLIREFMELYYGKAATEVRAYRSVLERAADQAKAHVGWFPSLSAYAFITAAVVQECYRRYDAALAAVRGDEELLARVEHAFMSLDRLYLIRAKTYARQLGGSASLPDPAVVAARYRRVFDREAKVRGYSAEQAGHKKGIKELFDFVEKARDLPVPAAFASVPQDALFLYPATFASTYYRGVRFSNDPESPVGRALVLDMSLVAKNPHKSYPWEAYNWPLKCTVWPLLDRGSQSFTLTEGPGAQPRGYHWYCVGRNVKLKAESVLSVLRGCYVPLDGVISDNSELGQEYDIWVSLKILGSDVYASGKPSLDTLYFCDQIAVVRKTKNAAK